MKKKILKKIIIFFILEAMFFCTTVNAFDMQEQLGTTDLSAYANVQNVSSVFNGKVSFVFGVISVAGTVMSIVALVCIGVRYMFGSVEEKAEYKKTMKPYIIGALMVFAITNLLTIFYKIFSNIF